MAINIEERIFGKLQDGSVVNLYRLSNQNGMYVEVSFLDMMLIFHYYHLPTHFSFERFAYVFV